MRVTKYKNITQEIPISDIDPCPLCGEHRGYKMELISASLRTGDTKFERFGIKGTKYIWFRRLLFKLNLYKFELDIFECVTCGAKWKSEVKKEVIKEN